MEGGGWWGCGGNPAKNISLKTGLREYIYDQAGVDGVRKALQTQHQAQDADVSQHEHEKKLAVVNSPCRSWSVCIAAKAKKVHSRPLFVGRAVVG